MFGIKSANGYIEILPGVSIKTLAHGNNMLTTEFVLKKGSELPMHKHPNEQAGYLVKGNIILYIDGVAKNLKPGDSWNIGGNVEHKAEIIEDSVALEIFSPVREDYFKFIMKEDIAN
jgi:quercetin dioxygenase-like cupin family protein